MQLPPDKGGALLLYCVNAKMMMVRFLGLAHLFKS